MVAPTWLWLVVGLLVFACLRYNRRLAKTRRRIRSMPVVPLAELEIGTQVRIAGSVEVLDRDLVGPLSGRRCVYYEVALYEDQGSERTSWERVAGDMRSVDFVVRDSRGAALVRVARAEIDADCDEWSYSGFLDDPNAEERALLERFNEEPTGFVFNRGLKYTERALEVGEEVTVVGVVRAGMDGFSRVIEAPPDGALLVSDDRYTVLSLPM